MTTHSKISRRSNISLASSKSSANLFGQFMSGSAHGVDTLHTGNAAGLLDGLLFELDRHRDS
jgi:hypothetical protein